MYIDKTIDKVKYFFVYLKKKEENSTGEISHLFPLCVHVWKMGPVYRSCNLHKNTMCRFYADFPLYEKMLLSEYFDV